MTHTKDDPRRKMSWRRMRIRILNRDAWTCQYCLGVALTVDHIMPQVRGGPADPRNLVGACEGCNQAKGHLTIAQWLAKGTAPALALGMVDRGVRRDGTLVAVEYARRRRPTWAAAGAA